MAIVLGGAVAAEPKKVKREKEEAEEKNTAGGWFTLETRGMVKKREKEAKGTMSSLVA